MYFIDAVSVWVKEHPEFNAHTDMPHEVTVIKGRRFPTCWHCKGISFELAHAARHVGEIPTFRRRMRRLGNRAVPPLWRAP